MVWLTSAASIGSELAMRAPIALGGGSRMKGMPAPRVTASQMIRIQTPKITGMTQPEQPARVAGDAGAWRDRIVDAAPGEQPGRRQDEEEGRPRRAFEAGKPGNQQPGRAVRPRRGAWPLRGAGAEDGSGRDGEQQQQG